MFKTVLNAFIIKELLKNHTLKKFSIKMYPANRCRSDLTTFCIFTTALATTPNPTPY